MAATRFYLGSVATPSISPAFDSNWEQTGQAVRRKLFYKRNLTALEALTTSTAVTIPITTTQDILIAQFVSDPLFRQRVRIDARNFSMVVGKCSEGATTANAHLAYSIRVISQDGGTVRGTLRSSFTTISEFPLVASAATRIISAGAVTALTVQTGDRLVLEVGIRASAPTAAGSGSIRTGFDAASDFALTSGLTTDLNSWCEFAQDLFEVSNPNLQLVKAGDGMSVTEGFR